MEFAFEKARSGVAAQDLVLEVIHKYKYHRAFCFESFLTELLIERAAPELHPADWDWIVPVPLHPLKQREREFNQAERLAAPLSGATGIPLNKRLLRRDLPTRTQTRLTREERLSNVRKAFSLRKMTPMDGCRIVLVDDVFTTGATTNACARVLREAGASLVCVWTVARGI
jgi:ComF family protein